MKMRYAHRVRSGAMAATGLALSYFVAVAAAQPHTRSAHDRDLEIVTTEVRVPGDGLLIMTGRATDLSNGLWRYEYDLYNVDARRSVGSFDLCFDPWLVLQRLGFDDGDSYSRADYDSTDWRTSVADGGANWSTQSFTANPDANALRPGVTYYFCADIDAPPTVAYVTLGLFYPGNPERIVAKTIGPADGCGNELDVDHDGESDCSDYCPDTPVGACVCQGTGWCCVGCDGPCHFEEPRDYCVENGGRPDECGDPRCRNGCLLFDMDNDADRDLADFAGLQRCFSLRPGASGYVAPSQACITRLDVNDDHSVDLDDYRQLFTLCILGK